ncbi:Uncharacterised protein [uncultured archaeon]|nr:Uncharacterised protein [uncultured archaeon]
MAKKTVKTYCIVCGNERKGIPVREDYVLGALRWFKKNVTRNEQGNALVVCKDCYGDYKKRRATYESRQKVYLVLGTLFIVVGVASSIGSGGFSVTTVLVSLGAFALLYILSLLSYMPKIDLAESTKSINTLNG